MKKIYCSNAQQGDVLLRKAKLPKGKYKVVPLDNGRIVVAYGEVTGHTHSLKSGELREYEDGSRFLVLDGPETITHDEHGAFTIDGGSWELGGVREHDYLNQMVVKVRD